jgi:hypothetical protein
MNISILPLLAGLCAVVASFAVPAARAERARDAAFEACLAQAHAAAAVTAVDDGRGGSLVWLTDQDNNLWLCNADADGHVYAYSMIFDDLLAGAGASLVTPIILDRDGKPVSPPPDPLATAELACRAYLDGEGGEVVARGADGLNTNWLPGYYVFLETEAGETFLCDATANAQVWAFARIGEPLDLANPVS